MRYVYTAITGGRDRLGAIDDRAAGWRYVCFTDGDVHPDWERRPATDASADPARNARAHKLRPDVHLPDAEISLWIDGNLEVACDVDELVARYVAETDLAFHRHPHRDCVYEEALQCIELDKDDPATIARQVLRYAGEGFPARLGLPATGVILRRHTAAVAAFNRRWAEELDGGSRRDQISVAYALHKEGIQYAAFDSDVWNGPLFVWRRHA
jgi:hypothetical protein